MPSKVNGVSDKLLDRNHAILFKQLLQNYEQKEYKKGIKNADAILKKYPSHGETMAMKGLILTNVDKKDEGWEYVRKGLRNDLKSHICWHVYGLLYRADKNYEESMKCYINALKFDPDNLVVLRDLAVIQSQLRLYPGLIETRKNLIKRQPEVQGHHTALAVAYHLNGDYANAEKTLHDYLETILIKPKHNAEHSMTVLYQNSIIADSGDYSRALTHIDLIESSVLDKLEITERRARYQLKLGNTAEAQRLCGSLLDINPDCHRYYMMYDIAQDFRNADGQLISGNSSQMLKSYLELQSRYPKSSVAKRLPLNWLTGDDFRSAVDKYLRDLLQKGVPSTFADIKALYRDKDKADTIERLVLSYLEEFKKSALPNSRMSGDTEKAGSSDVNGISSEPPTSYLWTLYFLAQSFDHRRNLTKALNCIDEAIAHTPTLVELLLTKARILKHSGSVLLAAEQMNVARELDLQDRFINTKSTKYFLRADQNSEAINTISLFVNSTLGGGSIGDLQEMQSIQFLVEDGSSYARQSLFGLALKRFESVKRTIDQWHEDEFDFHQYCFRKGTIDAYMSSMRWQETLYGHHIYKRAAAEAATILLRLHEEPAWKSGALESDKLPESERKKEKKRVQKIRARCAKDATREAEKKDGIDMHRKIDTDPLGDKLLETSSPLEDALKYLRPWLHDCPQDEAALKLMTRIYIAQSDYKGAIACIEQIPSQECHELIYRLKLSLDEDKDVSDDIFQETKEFCDSAIQGTLVQWNSTYLHAAKSADHIIIGSKIAYGLQTPVAEIEDRIFSQELDITSTSLSQARELLAILEKIGSARAAEYKNSIKSIWFNAD